jgi:hypothetical protein
MTLSLAASRAAARRLWRKCASDASGWRRRAPDPAATRAPFRDLGRILDAHQAITRNIDLCTHQLSQYFTIADRVGFDNRRLLSVVLASP